MKHWLIIYDVRDPKRLAKIAHCMVQFAVRVQKSVFEMAAPELQVNKLRNQVRQIMAEEDFVVYFELCERDWQKRERYGSQTFDDHQEKAYYIY